MDVTVEVLDHVFHHFDEYVSRQFPHLHFTHGAVSSPSLHNHMGRMDYMARRRSH
jgi:hypothetical protein